MYALVELQTSATSQYHMYDKIKLYRGPQNFGGSLVDDNSDRM